jgi:hypothetical protein
MKNECNHRGARSFLRVYRRDCQLCYFPEPSHSGFFSRPADEKIVSIMPWWQLWRTPTLTRWHRKKGHAFLYGTRYVPCFLRVTIYIQYICIYTHVVTGQQSVAGSSLNSAHLQQSTHAKSIIGYWRKDKPLLLLIFSLIRYSQLFISLRI